MDDELIVEPIRSLDALAGVRGPWRDLHRAAPDATPFQSPEWLIPWWTALGEGRLCACMAYSGEELVGMAPLYLWIAPDGARIVLLLGAGTSDYLDVLVRPSHRTAFSASIMALLADEPWDVCELAQLRARSALLDMPLPTGWRDERAGAEPCPVVEFPRGDSLADVVPTRMLQNLRYYRRRAERLGAVEVRRVSSRDEAIPFFERLAALHGVRWSGRGTSGVLSEALVRAAHRTALPQLFDAGMLRGYELTIAGSTVAALYALADPRPGGRHYYYVGGFDPAFAKASPGTLIIGHAIEQALAEGATAFDFLRGREPYKYLWGARDVATWHRRIIRPVQP